MKNRLDAFIRISYFFIAIIVIALACVIFLYINQITYHIVLGIFIAALAVILTLSLGMVMWIIASCKKGVINKKLAVVLNAAVKIIMPIIIELCVFLKVEKSTIRGFFVDFNNLLIKSIRPQAKKILLLVPHCLQLSDCTHKVTNNISNCKQCGRCTIGSIARISKDYNVDVCVASGGTVARNAARRTQPDIIVSVACARDLIGGILDVAPTHVIAVENSTPNGPCADTCVDVEKILQALELIKSMNKEEK